MFASVPSFPPFQQWERMSESEQDALIDRIEAARRRRARAMRICIGLACTMLSAGVMAALYLALAG
jgi:hypothetical protein